MNVHDPATTPPSPTPTWSTLIALDRAIHVDEDATVHGRAHPDVPSLGSDRGQSSDTSSRPRRKPAATAAARSLTPSLA